MVKFVFAAAIHLANINRKQLIHAVIVVFIRKLRMFFYESLSKIKVLREELSVARHKGEEFLNLRKNLIGILEELDICLFVLIFQKSDINDTLSFGCVDCCS